MASTRLLEILACLARSRPLRTLHTICETQHQVTTRKLEQYLEPIGDELAGYAFNLRMEYDALSAKLADAQRLLAERDAEIERLKSAPCECGAPVGYVSGEKYEAAQQRIRDYRNRIAALESQQAASVGGEREAFEEWAEANNHPTQTNSIGFYMPGTSTAWAAWQARAALALAEIERIDRAEAKPQANSQEEK